MIVDIVKTLAPVSRAVTYLIVDDDLSHLRLIQLLSADLGVPHLCHYVSSGEEALDFLHRRHPYEDAVRPDVILLDLNMPGMTGGEVLSVLKSDPITLSTPVVILSSSQAAVDVNTCYEHRANAYIQKPIDLDGNRRVLQQIDQFWSHVVLPTL